MIADQTTATIVAQMRTDFRTGMSITEVLRRARESLPETDRSVRSLVSCLRQAFHVLPGGLTLLHATETFGNGEKSDAVLEAFLLPRIVENWDRWNDSDSVSWIDGIGAADRSSIAKSVQSSQAGLTSESWQALTEDDRSLVTAIETSRITLSETIQVMAALIDRLQSRLNEVEEELGSRRQALLTT